MSCCGDVRVAYPWYLLTCEMLAFSSHLGYCTAPTRPSVCTVVDWRNCVPPTTGDGTPFRVTLTMPCTLPNQFYFLTLSGFSRNMLLGPLAIKERSKQKCFSLLRKNMKVSAEQNDVTWSGRLFQIRRACYGKAFASVDASRITICRLMVMHALMLRTELRTDACVSN